MTQVAGKGSREGDGEWPEWDDGCGGWAEAPRGCSAAGWALRPGGAAGVSLIRLPEDSLCMHSPSVQFLESSRVPLQSRPPFWGGGAMHSRLRQWAHSVLQADHLLHSVHAPSTIGA